MRKPDRAIPEEPAAEPETPLGAGVGPGAGLTGGLPVPEPPWPPVGGDPTDAATDATVAASPMGDCESSR